MISVVPFIKRPKLFPIHPVRIQFVRLGAAGVGSLSHGASVDSARGWKKSFCCLWWRLAHPRANGLGNCRWAQWSHSSPTLCYCWQILCVSPTQQISYIERTESSLYGDMSRRGQTIKRYISYRLIFHHISNFFFYRLFTGINTNTWDRTPIFSNSYCSL